MRRFCTLNTSHACIGGRWVAFISIETDKFLIEDQTDINSSMGKWSQKMPFREAILKTTADFFEDKNPEMVIPRSPTQVHAVNFATKMHVCVKCAGTGEIC